MSSMLHMSGAHKKHLIDEKKTCGGLKEKKTIKHLSTEMGVFDFFYGLQWLPLEIVFS